ncbi:MAG: hypothetical protein Kow0042_11090 [Calditrichia bacterium]
MNGRRKLVGRRFSDFLRHGIYLELTRSEKIWHNLITDFRYQYLLDRRNRPRRKGDFNTNSLGVIYQPLTLVLDWDEADEE